MSLLQALKLPVPKRLVAAHAAAGAAPHAIASPDMPAPLVKGDESHGAGASRHPIADPDQAKLRASIALQQEKARAMLAKIVSVEPALEKRIAAAQGDERKKLLAAQAEFEKKKKEAVHAIEEARTDLEALDNPGTRREEVVTILARHRAGMGRATEVEVDTAGLKAPTKANHDVTTTTTSYGDGKAVVDKVRDQHKVGLGGSTSTQSHETEVRNDKLAVKTGDEKTTHISTTGKASVETKKSVEVELADGRKAGIEHKDAKEISAKGASHEHTVTKTNFDGSSNVTTSKQEIERGEGKVTVKSGKSETVTNASGTAVKRDSSVSGGMIAGKDGIGAQGAVEKGKTVTSKGGHQAGVVAGLHANVVCNIGKPSGDPARYPVTLTVTFGGSVGVSAGTGKKEGSKASAGVQVSASEERSMTTTHMLTEAELGGYVQALEDASKKGGKVANTHREFAIIAAGVNQGWDAARQLWQGGAITKQTTDTLKHAGDSTERGQTSSRTAGANVNVMGVGAGHSETVTDTRSTKVTRNDKGALDVDAKAEHGKKTETTASLNVGVVGMKAGTVHEHKTRFGYSIMIDPKNDPDGKILAELALCKTQMQYQIFIATHTGKITVTGRTDGHSDAEGTTVGVSIGGAEASIGTHQGTDVDTKRDGTGKVVGQTVAGHAGAGGKILKWGDSVSEDAVATVDEKGRAELTLTRTKSDSDSGRSIKKKLSKVAGIVGVGGGKAEGEGGGKGALATAAGGDDDSEMQEVSGIKLSNAELKKLGREAFTSSWMSHTRRYQENEDWKKAGAAIVRGKGAPGVVAEELARFVGGDRVERLKTLETFIRGGHNPVKMGKAFEFPDAIRALQGDYETVVADSLPKELNEISGKDPAKAVEECKRLAALTDTLEKKITACDDFSNKSTKVEMLQRLEWRRQQLVEAAAAWGGNKNAESDPKLLKDKIDRLMKQCADFGPEQARVQGKLHDLLGGYPEFTVADSGDARDLLRELEHLQQRWMSNVYMLKDTWAKLGIKNVTLPPPLLPDEAMFQFYLKAARGF